MNKTTLISITVILIAIVGFIFIAGSKTNNTSSASVNNVEVKDGVQYITINAINGYSPAVTSAKAGMPTKLIVKTSGSYGCFSSLNIRSINYQKLLPQTGETEIDVGTPKAGVPLRGVCGMGMYNFVVNFN